MERIDLSGKIGVKLSVDFTEAKIILKLYLLFSGADLRIFIIGKVRVFSYENKLFNKTLINEKIKKINLDKNFTFYLNNSEIADIATLEEFE